MYGQFPNIAKEEYSFCQSVLFRKRINVFYAIHTKHRNPLCDQNVKIPECQNCWYMKQQLRSEAAMCKMRPFYPCSEAGDLISETRNKNMSNSTNNYFMSICIKIVLRNMFNIDSTTYLSYQDVNGSFSLIINGSLSLIQVSTAPLGFVGYMLKSRKVKWWLNP